MDKRRNRTTVPIISEFDSYLGFAYHNDILGNNEGLVVRRDNERTIIYTHYSEKKGKLIGTIVAKYEAIKIIKEKNKMDILESPRMSYLRKYYLENKIKLDKELNKWKTK